MPSDKNKEEIEAKSKTWSMEAERVSMDDPLLECLAILASENGRRTTAAALAAGLPVPRQGMASPQLFVRAADRVNMCAKMVKKPLEYLVHARNLPCILVLKGDHACVLRGSKNGEVEVSFPETPEKTASLAFKELEEQYRGYAFFVQTVAQLDERSGPSKIEEGRDWFWSAILRHRGIYGEVIVAALMINLFALVSPLFMMNVYDRVLPNAAFDTLWVLAIGAGTAFLFDFLLKNLRVHFLDTAGAKADNVISSRIFEQMLGMKMESRPASAGAMAANMKEFETIRDFFTSATMASLIDFPFLLIFILLIGVIGNALVFVPAAMIPIVLGVGYFLQKKLNKTIKEAMKEGGYKTSLIFETLTGLETLKVQAVEGYTQRKWEEITEKSSSTNVKMRRINAFAVNFAGLATSLSSVFVVIYGTYLVTLGELSMGGLIACVILTGRAMAPLGQIAGLLTRLGQAKETFSRLDEFMKSPVERPMDKTFMSKTSLTGSIEFKAVTFSYPNQERPALNNIDFKIEAGERFGIIGAVGSGKTTLERLILNLYQPESGSVMLDGVDVRQIDPADLRRNVGVVQQDPTLFFGTVRENITLGHETVSDDAILHAAEISGVMDFLKESSAGLDTPVGERGELLSGGQRQSIAIARALLYDPPILLMDEPTASIDPGSERKLYKYLEGICKDKTVILITHKSSVLGLVDNLILMDRGNIVANGSRDDVIKKLQTGNVKGSEKMNTDRRRREDDS